MKGLFVIDRNLFAGLDVSQGKEQHVTVQCSHEGIRLAGMIDVVRAVTATRAIETESAVDVADAQDLTIASPPTGFEIRNPLARVLRNLLPAFEGNSRETASAVDRRLADRQAVREFERHRAVIVRIKRAGVNRPS